MRLAHAHETASGKKRGVLFRENNIAFLAHLHEN